jgi:uncharacterized membrane protein
LWQQLGQRGDTYTQRFSRLMPATYSRRRSAMNLYLIILLRIIHIIAGVCWVGGAVVHTFFIEPSVKATAPESRKFMQYLMSRQQYGAFMGITSLLTVLAGGLLYWRSSGGFAWAWITSGPGIMFSIGAVIGIAVYLWGTLLIAPRAARLGALGAQIGAAGGPPTPEQAAELHKLDRQMSFIGRVDFVLLAIALFTMATARYWYV